MTWDVTIGNYLCHWRHTPFWRFWDARDRCHCYYRSDFNFNRAVWGLYPLCKEKKCPIKHQCVQRAIVIQKNCEACKEKLWRTQGIRETENLGMMSGDSK